MLITLAVAEHVLLSRDAACPHTLTHTLGSAGTGTESLITDAAVTAHSILTAAVLTDAWFSCAFIQI